MKKYGLSLRVRSEFALSQTSCERKKTMIERLNWQKLETIIKRTRLCYALFTKNTKILKFISYSKNCYTTLFVVSAGKACLFVCLFICFMDIFLFYHLDSLFIKYNLQPNVSTHHLCLKAGQIQFLSTTKVILHIKPFS